VPVLWSAQDGHVAEVAQASCEGRERRQNGVRVERGVPAPVAGPGQEGRPRPGPSVRRRTEQQSGTGSQRYTSSVIAPTGGREPSPLSVTGPVSRPDRRSQDQS
jgi:hypothetical protein